MKMKVYIYHSHICIMVFAENLDDAKNKIYKIIPYDYFDMNLFSIFEMTDSFTSSRNILPHTSGVIDDSL